MKLGSPCHSMMKVYVYEEYKDDEAWGERITRVFASEADAVRHLHSRVEEHFKCRFEDVPKQTDDTLSDSYVSISGFDGSVMYWSVTETEVE